MTQIRTLLVKEFTLLTRDRQALILLFAMPVVFIVSLSIALKNVYLEKTGVVLPVSVDVRDAGALGPLIRSCLEATGSLQLVEPGGAVPPSEVLRAGVVKAVVVIPSGFSEAASRFVDSGGTELLGDEAILVTLEPSLDAAHAGLLRLAVEAAVERAILEALWEDLLVPGDVLPAASAPEAEKDGGPATPPSGSGRLADPGFVREGRSETRGKAIPHPLQHNVPAWSLFAMFFIAQPLAANMLREKETGTLGRILVYPVPRTWLLLGKIVPYFVVNVVQFFSMLFVGLYLVPHVVGARLDIGVHSWLVIPATLAVSAASTGFGMLVAALARSQEQVSAFVATSVIVMAAVGGIMVPSFVMPPVMQRIGMLSPLNWGLQSYMDIFLRDAGLLEILPEMGGLLLFAAGCILVSLKRINAGWVS